MANVIDDDTAFNVAKWSGLGLIAFYGYCAGRLAGAGTKGALLQAFAVALIGGALIAVKALLHCTIPQTGDDGRASPSARSP